MRIAVFATCLVGAIVPRGAQATVRLLERLGHTVEVPPAQTCCGQMHVNTGYGRQALRVIRSHVAAFAPVLDGEWDAVVAPSGSCAAAARHQQASVARAHGDERLASAAELVAGYTYELSELLVDVLGVTDVGAWFPHSVTYHPTCHSMRMLHVGDRPTRLLRAVEGLELRDLGAERHERHRARARRRRPRAARPTCPHRRRLAPGLTTKWATRGRTAYSPWSTVL